MIKLKKKITKKQLEKTDPQLGKFSYEHGGDATTWEYDLKWLDIPTYNKLTDTGENVQKWTRVFSTRR